jgi:hypothetical protein
MAAVIGAKVYKGELAGNTQILEITGTLTTNTDTITLTSAVHGLSPNAVLTVVADKIETGMGANFATLQSTVAGFVITVASFNAAGAVATTFGLVRLIVKIVEPTT